uniref:Uncharacterized protein n=1 Tax=Acrobeloides nanus TaxID=290746 RepID=A0A914DM77_9BILA
MTGRPILNRSSSFIIGRPIMNMAKF